MPPCERPTVSLQAENMPFSMLMNRLLAGSNVSATFDNSVNANQVVSLQYVGTVQGALNRLAAKLNYYYSPNNSQVNWSAFETRTFNISFMPGSSNYLVGRSHGGIESNGHSVGTTVGGLNDQQYSSLEGQLSVWNDLRNTLNELKSKKGKFFVSESTTSVTVHDRPRNVAAMARYISILNESLSKEVGIKVEVLEIQLDKQYNSGINWNAVANTLNTTLKLTASLASATNPIASNIIRNSGTSPLASFQIGAGNEATMIEALSRQGKLRVVTRPQIVTLNNQIASIRITQNTGYIESVNSSFTNDYVTTSITPGTVIDGFTLYILPKIQGNRVYMQISSVISNLLNLQKESTEPTSGGSTKGNQQYNAIEVPTISQRAFNQRSLVTSGTTLVIAGFKQLRDQASGASLFGVGALGGKGAETKNIETLVLITPTILRTS